MMNSSCCSRDFDSSKRSDDYQSCYHNAHPREGSFFAIVLCSSPDYDVFSLQNEHYECEIDLFPGKEYLFEVHGKYVTLAGSLSPPRSMLIVPIWKSK